MISYELNNEFIKKLKELSELCVEKRKFIESLDEAHKDAILRYARISSIGASTRIENALLTDTEIDWLDQRLSMDARAGSFNKEKDFIENKLSRDAARSIEEVTGYRNVLLIIHSQFQDLFPLSETALRGLHKELLQYYSKASHYAGKYKKVTNSVVEKNYATGTSFEVLRTADAGPVTESAMHDLIAWYNASITNFAWPVAVATEFVFRFLAIHPFQDGNGRMGRALFLLSLLQCVDENIKTVIPYVAIDRHIERKREEYYLALRKCSGGKYLNDPGKYKMEYFLQFMLKVMKDSIEKDINFYANKYTAFLSLSESAQKVLKCFREYPEKQLQTKDIVKLTSLPRRTVIHSINILEQKAFLQKTGTGPSTKYKLTF